MQNISVLGIGKLGLGFALLLEKNGYNVLGLDISEEYIFKLNNKFIKFDTVEDFQLNTKFDIIFVANVFHHIPADLHLTTLKYLRSSLSPDGYLYVFEHNPKNPLTRKVFETCEFDVGCRMINSALFIKMCVEKITI